MLAPSLCIKIDMSSIPCSVTGKLSRVYLDLYCLEKTSSLWSWRAFRTSAQPGLDGARHRRLAPCDYQYLTPGSMHTHGLSVLTSSPNPRNCRSLQVCSKWWIKSTAADYQRRICSSRPHKTEQPTTLSGRAAPTWTAQISATS